MSTSNIKRLATGQYVRVISDADGTRFVPVSKDEQVKLTQSRDNKTATLKNFQRGVVVGGGIATAELVTGAVTGGVAVAEAAVAIPTVITVAAIGGLGYGAWRAAKWLSNNTSVSDDKVSVGSLAIKVPSRA